MKRTFLARRNALLSSTNMSWGFLAVAGAMLLFFVRLIAPNFFWSIFAPIFRVTDTLATESHILISGFGSTTRIALQNEQLVHENQALSSENEALMQKNASLSALLGSPGNGSQKNMSAGIIAGVVSRPPESPYDSLLLSSGMSKGVLPGQEVFGMGGVPIGIISSVTDDFSRAILFSAPSMVMHGWIGAHANIPITIFGSGGGAMSASLSRSVGVAVGDTVFAPGPGALPIGIVTRIDSDPTAPGVMLRIQPALNPFSITWVELRDTGELFAQSLSWATSTTP